MDIVPVVQLDNGQPGFGDPRDTRPLETPFPDGGTDTLGFVRHLYVRFGQVLVVDHGEGRSRDAHHNLVQKLARHQVLLWVDGHALSLEDIMDRFVSGAERVTVRMGEVKEADLEDVLEIAEGEIWLGYPFRDDASLARLLREHPVERWVGRGAAGVLLMDLGAAGGQGRIDPGALRHVSHVDVPVYYAGGVSSESDVLALRDAGASGVCVGTALMHDVAGWAALANRLGDPDADSEAGGDDTAYVETPGGGRPMFPGIVPSPSRIEYEVDLDEHDDEAKRQAGRNAESDLLRRR